VESRTWRLLITASLSACSVALASNHGPRMHSSQPRPGRRCPDLFAPNHEHHCHQIVHHQHSGKDAADNNSITVLGDPIEHLNSQPEAYSLLGNVHNHEHLRQIRRVRIHSVRECDGEVKVPRPLRQRDPHHVQHPVQVELRRQPKKDRSHRRNHHRRQHDTQPHLGLSYPVVALGQSCCQSIAPRKEGKRETEADEGRDGEQAHGGLRPVVGRRDNLEREDKVEGEAADDVDAVCRDDPQGGWNQQIREAARHHEEEGFLGDVCALAVERELLEQGLAWRDAP